MFEKIITNLKKSLPEALRRKMGETDDLDDEENLEELQSDSSDNSAVNLDEDSEEEKKKKMKSMVIKVIVILALGFFALDEFILKENPEPKDSVVTSKTSSPKYEIIEEAETTAEVPPASEETETTEVAESVTSSTTAATETEMPTIPTDDSIASEAPPIENINMLEKTEESALTEPVEPIEPIAKNADELPLQPDKTYTPSEAQPEEQIISQSRMGESTVDKRLDDLVDNVEQSAPKNPVEEVKIPSNGESVPGTSMASKIVEEMTETLPPVYDQVGRGLVYNCKDKYWACLNKPAYVTCSNNQKYNKSKGNSAECVVADIYSSDEDCAKVQKYNVSTSVPTAFCQN